jgi:hypothetical protein
MEEPEFSAASPAGKERYEGSIYLYREAELMRVRVKKEMLAMDRYREMQTETQKMREKNQQHEKVKNTSFDAIEQAKNYGCRNFACSFLYKNAILE